MADDISNDDQHSADGQPEDKNWRAARERMERQDAELAELRKQNRTLQLTAVGIDPESALGKIAMQVPSLDDDTIKELKGTLSGAPQAEEESPEAPEPNVSDGERSSTQVRQNVASGAAPDSAQVPNIYDEARSVYDEAMRNGASNEDALAQYVSIVNYAGQSVDPKWHGQVDARAIQNDLQARSPVQGGKMRH